MRMTTNECGANLRETVALRGRLVAELEAHGMAWREDASGGLWCLAVWTRTLGDGSLELGETWERVERTMPAVRAWLGY